MTDDLPFFLLAIGLAALAFLLGLILRRAGAGRRAAEADRLRIEAAARGLRYEAATGAPAPGQSPAAAAAPAGAHVFSGSSAGLAWSALVEADLYQRTSGRRRVRVRRTRITFPEVTAAPGTFLLAVALPPGVQVPELPAGSGFLAGLAERAAEGVLDLWVDAYFGAGHRALVNVAGAARPAGPPGLFVLSTDQALASRLLGVEGRALLAALDRPAGGPGEQAALQGFGLLVSPAGLTFGCQAALSDPTVLRSVAERVARLAAAARIQRPPPLT